jgi:hypothetical protein
MRMASVGNLSNKARYNIGDRHEDKESERRERAEERDGRSQSVDGERDDVLSGVKRESSSGSAAARRSAEIVKKRRKKAIPQKLQRAVDHRRERSEIRIGDIGGREWDKRQAEQTARCWPK